MRALVVGVLAVAASGCAMVDGLGGDGSDDDGGGECDVASLFLETPAIGAVTSVTINTRVTHTFPGEVRGEIEHMGTYADFQMTVSGAVETHSFPTQYSGLEASGAWFIYLRDEISGDDGTWDELTLEVCGDSCETTTAADLPTSIPYCAASF